jgi:hypothetical protein
VADGVTGFVRDHPEELPAAINRCHELSPRACRRQVALNFDVSGMVSSYEDIFRRALRAPMEVA